MSVAEAARARHRASWLKDVPPSWQVVQLRRAAKLVNGGTPRADESFWGGDVIWVTPEDLGTLRKPTLSTSRRTLTDEGVADSSAEVVPAGSIVLSTRAPIGHVAIADVPVAFNQGCRAAIPSKSLDARFLYYVLRAARKELEARGQGTTFRELSSQSLAAFHIPLPPREEQKNIVHRLDRKLEHLDALVHAKNRLLRLLRERRSQTTRGAVFHGLDGEGCIRDAASALPRTTASSWRRTRLKYLFKSMKNGVWGSDPSGDENDIVCVRVADFDRVRHVVKADKLTLRSISPAERAAHALRPGDILLEKSGGGEQQPVGEPVLFDHDFAAVCSNFIARLRPARSEEPRFLWYLLTSLYEARANVPFIKQTTGIQNLDAAAFFAQPCHVPERDEQIEIARYLDAKTEQIDRLHRTIETQLGLLEEHRDTLIFNAVVGQLRE